MDLPNDCLLCDGSTLCYASIQSLVDNARFGSIVLLFLLFNVILLCSMPQFSGTANLPELELIGRRVDSKYSFAHLFCEPRSSTSRQVSPVMDYNTKYAFITFSASNIKKCCPIANSLPTLFPQP